MRIALAGQPNCGKSTIFNHIAGYKAITSNFPGTTVKYTETKTHINGITCNCIDLPGTYSLTSGDPAELEARKHLLLPPLQNTLKKSWYRIREFIVIAWPLLIIGSALLALMEYGGVEKYITWFLSPLTYLLLGLPVSVGMTLIFGLLRKELSMIMLTQALGTTQIIKVMTKSQILVFTIFVTFYIPCLATIAALWKEIGKKGALLAILFTLSVAIILAFIIRIFLGIFLG
jgi:Fe2+ transport system protein B